MQPPDPLDEWATPPFEPTERDGFLFGRGVSDNKGNLLARLQAIEAYRATISELPLRIRVLYEGEEESGSSAPRRVRCPLRRAASRRWLHLGGGLQGRRGPPDHLVRAQGDRVRRAPRPRRE